MLLRLDGISKGFAGRTLFSGVDLDVRAGDRIGLVGPNGAGKTTLLRIVAEDEAPDAGRVVVSRGVGGGMRRLEFDPTLERPVREVVA